MCKRVPIITHLLFANDYILFFRAEEKEGKCLKEILEVYEKTSDQVVNLAKSELYFSKNTSSVIRDRLVVVLGVSKYLGTGRYLGLPSMIGRKKKAMFNYLKDCIWKKVQSWSGKHLPKAGREILVKTVAQSIYIGILYELFPYSGVFG